MWKIFKIIALNITAFAVLFFLSRLELKTSSATNNSESACSLPEFPKPDNFSIVNILSLRFR